MTSREFCYWLQGYFEIAGGQTGLTADQAETVQRHLSMVFAHEIDPSYPKQDTLKHLHDPKAFTMGEGRPRC